MAIEDDLDEQLPPNRCNPNLPHEIINDILLRLPVKSLLRFRSVSKSWRSMISNPKFVKHYLTICSKDGAIDRHKIIFGNHYEIKTCHLSPMLNGFSVNPAELEYPMKQSGFPVSIVGSIDGLICIIIEEKYVFLWNPSTRILKKLPDTCIKLRWKDQILYGFGYDDSNDDYKVVAFTTSTSQVMLYSSRVGFWRTITDFPSNMDICLDENCMFVNGAIHWHAIKCNVQVSQAHQLILSLDLANETYSEIELPTYDKSEGLQIMGLGALGECLCVSFHFWEEQTCTTDVWMMKEYGVRESWTKLTTIPSPRGIYSFGKCPRLLHLSNKGEILLEYVGLLFLYDPQSKSFRNPDIHGFELCPNVCTYFESLVSP